MNSEFNPRLERVLRGIASLGSLAAVAIGALVLLGWQLDHPQLKGMLHPGQVPMNPLTAVLFVLAGIALWMLRGETVGGRHMLGRVLGGAVLLLALGKLVDYRLAILPDLDAQLFFFKIGPNRMGTNLAAAFLLVGLALVSMEVRVRGRYWLAQGCVLVIGVITLLSQSSYLGSILLLHGISPFFPLALDSTREFLILSLALFCVRPRREPVATFIGRSAGGSLARGLLPFAVAVPLLLDWVSRQGEHLYGLEFGLSLFTLLNVLAFAVLIWWNASSLSRVDAERQRSRQALQASEARFRDIAESMGDWIWEVDARGCYTYCSEQIRQILGYSVEEMLGRTPFEFMEPEEAERVEGIFTEIAGRPEAIRELETWNRTRDGRRVCLQTSGKPILGTEGELLGYRGVDRDITQRKRMEQELVQAEERLRTIFDSVQAGIMLIDAEKRTIVDANPAACRMIGAPREQVTARICHQFACPAEEGNCPIVDLEQKVGNAERVLLTANGEQVPIIKTVLPITLNGHPHLLESFVDIRDLKRTEAQLRAAKQEAEEANRAKSIFLANMSHEIRTPMNAIIGFTDLLQSTELTTEQRDYARTVQSSSHALLELINDILDFSKIEAGKLEMESRAFRLRQVLEQTADLFREKVAETGVELIVDVADGVPDLLIGDPLRLRQVLVNLTGNAVKFTEKGEVEIGVECVAVSGDRATLRLAVRDTGIGIIPEKVGRLFSAFTQVDGSTTRKYGGTGLGLAVCKQLVALMGGEIEVESEQGKGSLFRFTARFGLGEEGGEDETACTGDEFEGRRVLVIDDNLASLRVARHQLESLRLRVATSTSAGEGLQALREGIDAGRPFDLLLIDWRMPERDGLDASREIRTDRRLSDLPIVMMTAFGREGEKAQAEAIGIDAFLIKPVKTALLIDALRQIFVADGRGAVARSAVDGENERKASREGRILLAEDNPINQRLAVILLERAGYGVDVTADGCQALEAVQSQAYDAVLMDVQMPVMDGLEATRAIRRLSGMASLPIIAMTASAMKGDRERCLEAGMDDYVSKPIDARELFAALDRWLGSGDGEGTEAPIAPAADGAMADLPGIEVVELWQRLQGNEGLMRELLFDFAEQSADAVGEIRRGLAAGDRSLARRLTHTLKGTAGNLAARPLHEAALKLERAILEERGEGMEELFDSLDRSLAEVVGAIREMQARTEAQTGNAGEGKVAGEGMPDGERLSPLIFQLYGCIKDCDPVAAESSLNSFKEETGACAIDRDVRQIESAVGEFDFESARQRLEKVAERLGIVLDGERT